MRKNGLGRGLRRQREDSKWQGRRENKTDVDGSAKTAAGVGVENLNAPLRAEGRRKKKEGMQLLLRYPNHGSQNTRWKDLKSWLRYWISLVLLWN